MMMDDDGAVDDSSFVRCYEKIVKWVRMCQCVG